MIKILNKFFLSLLIASPAFVRAQVNTWTPYSRYGFGEPQQGTFAHLAGMAGTSIAFRPDSVTPGTVLLNTGNPAAYALIKLTSLEVGGNFLYSQLSSSAGGLRKWGTNFSYGALGFPVRQNGGAAFGIMPFSHVGYELKSVSTDANAGNINYSYTGSGGLNKVFAGYGMMPFKKSLLRFRKKHLHVDDSLRRYAGAAYYSRENFYKLLSDFSVGFNANYIFGTIENNARVIYPNTMLYNNTYRSRTLSMGDFTGNFGLQTAYTIDSVGKGASRRALKEKVKFTAGFFMSLNNPMRVTYDAAVYNYIVNAQGQEIIRDTVLYKADIKGSVSLPLEQGFGLGFKKGERFQLVADYATTKWSAFRLLDQPSSYNDNHRISMGLNYVPEKYAAGSGAFFRQMNYRAGISYHTGYITIRDQNISGYSVTAGLGLPVGISRLTSMVHVAVTYGQNGTASANLVKESFWRVNFGFTFSDRWFQKFRYD